MKDTSHINNNGIGMTEMNSTSAARQQAVPHACLEKRLNIPNNEGIPIIFNLLKMWATWLLWTNQSMATLRPDDPTLRARVCSQLSVLSTASGLFLVVAIAGFLVPPDAKHEGDETWVNIYGCLMFTASVCLLFYTGISLTGMFPLLESIRDDVAFEALGEMHKRIGNYETYLFFFGLHLIIVALFVAAKVIYSDNAFFIMFAISGIIVFIVTFISKELFIALDPISSVHMGITYDPEVKRRAKVLSHFLRRKHAVDMKAQEASGTGGTGHREGDGGDRDGGGDCEMDIFDLRREAALMEAETDAEGADTDEVGAECDEGTYGSTPLHVFPPLKSKEERSRNLDGSRGGNAGNGEKSSESPELAVLRVLFCDPDQHMFRCAGLKVRDSSAAYQCLVHAGCDSFEELLSYLNHHKQPRICNCTAVSDAAQVSKNHHTDGCECRQAGAWTGALTEIGIPAFHALKIVLAVKSQLS